VNKETAMATLSEYATDDDARALQSLPPGYWWVEALGWFMVGRLGAEPLGPYPNAGKAVEMADREDRRTRTEGDPRD
jgi:hypothetical protein